MLEAECDDVVKETSGTTSVPRWRPRGESKTGSRRLSSVVESEEASAKKRKVELDITSPPRSPVHPLSHPEMSWANALETFRKLAGERVSVRGNGFCWQYAVLAALGALERPTRLTARDYAVSAALLNEMQKRIRVGIYDKWMTPLTPDMRKVLLDMVAPTASKDTGTYGGDVCHRILAQICEISIIVTDETMMQPNSSIQDVKVCCLTISHLEISHSCERHRVLMSHSTEQKDQYVVDQREW